MRIGASIAAAVALVVTGLVLALPGPAETAKPSRPTVTVHWAPFLRGAPPPRAAPSSTQERLDLLDSLPFALPVPAELPFPDRARRIDQRRVLLEWTTANGRPAMATQLAARVTVIAGRTATLRVAAKPGTTIRRHGRTILLSRGRYALRAPRGRYERSFPDATAAITARPREIVIVETAAGAAATRALAQRLVPLTAPTVIAPGAACEPWRLERLADLRQPRAAHSATLLEDGRVLLAGGLERAATSTEIFDPAKRWTTPGPALLGGHMDHVAARLPDGRVLLAGGYDGTADTYATELVTATTSLPGPPLLRAREGAASATLHDGRVWVAGGVDGNQWLDSIEVFDPGTPTFTPGGTLAIPRRAAFAVTLVDGRVLITGGSRARGGAIEATTEIWTDDYSVTAGPSLQKPRHKHAAVMTPQGVLVAGGATDYDSNDHLRDAEMLGAGQRLGVFSLSDARYKHGLAAVALPDGRVVLAGGADDVEVVDPATGSTCAVARLDGARAFSTATLLDDGRLLIAGGYSSGINASREAWLLTPPTSRARAGTASGSGRARRARG